MSYTPVCEQANDAVDEVRLNSYYMTINRRVEGGAMTVDIGKLIKSPEVSYDYDKKNESLLVTVELPGVEPEAFDLRMAMCGFCITADTSEIHFNGCYRFFHEVDADNAKINFKNGTLSIKVPFFNAICGKQFPIDID